MTIYDIAKELNISASTVSRVVNNKQGVHPKTRAKILALLDKYHYTPNLEARGLVTRSSRLIGILVSDIRNVHYTEGAYHIERELAALDYCCIIFNVGDDDAGKLNSIQLLKQRRVEGLVIVGSTFQNDAVRDALKTHVPDIPIVMINAYLDLPNVCGVLSDEMEGVRSCVRYLAGQGRKQLAFVQDCHTPSCQLKVEGYLKGMEELGGSPVVYETASTLAGGYEITQRMMEEHPELDGLIYSVDLIAVGGMRALADRGLSVPGQVAVMGIDNSIYGEMSTPKLTSLDNQTIESSVAAVRLLMDRLEGRKAPQKMMLFSTIKEREST